MRFSNRNERSGNAKVGEQVDVAHEPLEFRGGKKPKASADSDTGQGGTHQTGPNNVASGDDQVATQIGIDLSKWGRR